MKHVFLLFLFICASEIVCGQTDSNIVTSELPEIIVVSKKNDKRRFLFFNLNKYFLFNSASIRCAESLGVLVPQAVKKEIYIKDIVIPIKSVTQSLPRGNIDIIIF